MLTPNVYLTNIKSIKTQINTKGGTIEIAFKDGSGLIMQSCGDRGTLSDIETIRGKRGNFAVVWCDFYFSERTPSSSTALIDLLTNVIYPFITDVYEN